MNIVSLISVTAILLSLIAFQVPIGVALAMAGAVGLLMVGGPGLALSTITTSVISTSNDYALLTIPVFILMAQFIIVSGSADELFGVIDQWTRKIYGGLGIATIITGAAFGAISGSSIASAATLSATAQKAMVKSGYSASTGGGLIAIVGTLAALIPPSNIVIIYGLLTGVAIGPLLIAGILPGLFAVLALILCLWIVLFFHPLQHPESDLPKDGFSLKRQLTSTFPILALFLMITAVLFLGIATPVESASLGALGALLIVFANRRFSLKVLVEALRETSRVSAMITLIIYGAHVFGYFLTLTQVTQTIVEYITTLQVDRYAILLGILAVYIVLGCFMDQIAILVLTLPITFPIIQSLNFDTIWFGILIVLTAEIGFVTPPLGLNVFVVARYVNLPTGMIFRGTAPFLFTMFLVLMALVYFPSITLALPNMMR